jgi:hypothetical protein
MVGYMSMLLRNLASRLSAVNADSRAYATVTTANANASRWFYMQAGVAKFTKGFTKRPAKGLLGVPT